MWLEESIQAQNVIAFRQILSNYHICILICKRTKFHEQCKYNFNHQNQVSYSVQPVYEGRKRKRS